MLWGGEAGEGEDGRGHGGEVGVEGEGDFVV